MTKRIIVPAVDQSGLDAQVAQHFGRAPFFAVVDLDENGNVLNVKTEANTGEHTGGVGSPHDILLSLKPDAIAVFGMGPRGLLSFENAGATVLKAEGTTVKEVIAAFKAGKLGKVEGGCEHAHHH
ncbi:MAG: NifB/NifX family molybdenum-iron cluster-binding protein [Candidatus Bathyarchaeota archaeon]|nr:NifB/NifX family molybdenum-iron cluster-binding protein [Candidatus Bathyarchaeota archaeon]